MAIKIFIDQGHNPTGYYNSGANANELFEEDVTFSVGQYLAEMLKQDTRFEVRLSRPVTYSILGIDNASSLIQRVNMANSWPADYFISIHANYTSHSEVNGSEVLIYKKFTPANWLARQVLDGIVDEMNTTNNGVLENATVYVLRTTSMPSILVELGYLTNEEDAKKLSTNPYGFARGIYNGIIRYFGFK